MRTAVVCLYPTFAPSRHTHTHTLDFPVVHATLSVFPSRSFPLSQSFFFLSTSTSVNPLSGCLFSLICSCYLYVVFSNKVILVCLIYLSFLSCLFALFAFVFVLVLVHPPVTLEASGSILCPPYLPFAVVIDNQLALSTYLFPSAACACCCLCCRTRSHIQYYGMPLSP